MPDSDTAVLYLVVTLRYARIQIEGTGTQDSHLVSTQLEWVWHRHEGECWNTDLRTVTCQTPTQLYCTW